MTLWWQVQFNGILGCETKTVKFRDFQTVFFFFRVKVSRYLQEFWHFFVQSPESRVTLSLRICDVNHTIILFWNEHLQIWLAVNRCEKLPFKKTSCTFPKLFGEFRLSISDNIFEWKLSNFPWGIHLTEMQLLMIVTIFTAYFLYFINQKKVCSL